MSPIHAAVRPRSSGQVALEVLLITALAVVLIVSLADDSALRELMAALEAQHARLLKALSLP
jgi:hypothetical protein